MDSTILTQPVALARDLPAGRVMRAQIGGADIAVWRAHSGAVAAWENRCPHRGMRLSHGFVRGESLACLYHGWHFGADGGCSYIPAHPDLDPPATIRTVGHGVAEADGVIWVAPGGAATPRALPQGLAPLRSLWFEAPSRAALAALAGTCIGGTTPIQTPAEAGTATFRGMLESTRVTVAVALHDADPSRTGAHMLVSPGLTPAQMTALSQWCEAARRRAEIGTRGHAA